MMLAEIITGWPEAFSYSVGAICVASFFIGNWPWQGVINIHKHYHNTRKKKGETEDTE